MAVTSATEPSAPRAAGGSVFLPHHDAPATLYQTKLVQGRQDNATPQVLRVHLAKATYDALVATGAPPGKSIHGAIRRFDGRELEVFDEASAEMLGLRIPQQTFDYTLHRNGVLDIDVHRKEMPVSVAHSNCPFVLVFLVTRAGAEPDVVTTRPFMVASKEPKARAPRAPPKRVRAPPPRRPFAAPATGREAQINDLLGAVAGGAPAPAAGAGAGAAPLPAPEAAQALEPPVPRKRLRVVRDVAPAPVAPAAPVAPPAPITAPDAPMMDDIPSPFAFEGLSALDPGAVIDDFRVGSPLMAVFGDVPLPVAIELPIDLA